MISNAIQRLQKSASKKNRLIVGLMSGTSLDGLDIALCKISGSGASTSMSLVRFVTIPYARSVKEKIRTIFAKPQINFLTFTELNSWIGVLHGQMVLKALAKWKISPRTIDAIASHGQTVFHAPKSVTRGATRNTTFQAGDGDHLAVTAGITVLSDFRQKHIAAGGEGAPLAVYGDYLLFSKKGENRIMLNIGGIGNFTYLPATGSSQHVFVTDTGPGNTLLDQTIQRYFPKLSFDRDAKIARQGKVNESLLKALKADLFFKLPFPKTTGPELFNMHYVDHAIMSSVSSIEIADLMATLTRFSADTIADSIKKTIGTRKFQIYTSGGGAHNPLMLQRIKEQLPGSDFHAMDSLGISGDAKEAVLFALLANETLCGGKYDFGNRSKIPSVTMGKISFPD